MRINYILTGEGPTDLRLAEHIENLLIEGGFSEVSGETLDPKNFGNKIGRSVREKIRFIINHYKNIDVIFVHRDADQQGLIQREREVYESSDGIIEKNKIIPVIPVTMLETWLLADRDAIKRIAGNPQHKGSLACLPPIKNIEKVLDPKKRLLDALCEASGLQGRSLALFKKRFSEMRARLTFDLDPEGPIKQLSSYQHFRDKIHDFCKSNIQNNLKQTP